jgi:hypothetical protein
VAYLGYDRCGLGVLLAALDEAMTERLPLPSAPNPWSETAASRHRQAVARVAAFAEPIGMILRGDPLGRFGPVHLDPADLRWWSVSRGGRWATVTDPTILIGGPQQDAGVQNARLVAEMLRPDDLRAMFRHPDRPNEEGLGAAAVARYVSTLAADRPARLAFLDALGPDRFGELLAVAGGVLTANHALAGPAPAIVGLARAVVDGLGRLWATARADGALTATAWDRAAFEGDLAAASRLLLILARTLNALSTTELARRGGELWTRLVKALGTSEAPWPEMVGADVLTALATDGRAARRFLTALSTRSRRHELDLLLTNAASPPELSGALLLASSQPGSVVDADDDAELGRTMQAVLREITRLLDGHCATFARVDDSGMVEPQRAIPVLPTDLGLYVGRWLSRLIDPCDDARAGACPIDATVWPGWRDREVAHVLELLATDPRAAAQLDGAVIAEYTHRLDTLDLTDPRSDRALENAAFDVAAVGAVVRNHKVQRAIDDDKRFEQMSAGLDLVITVAATALPEVEPLVAGAETWSWASKFTGVEGAPTPGKLVLSPWRPSAIRDVMAATRGDDAARAAVLQRTAAVATLGQLHAAGLVDELPPLVIAPTTTGASIPAVRHGHNANAPAVTALDDVQRWVDAHRDEAAGQRIEQLLDSVGEAAARGANWVA